MLHSAYKLVLMAGLVGLLLPGTPTAQEKKTTHGVRDEAMLFSAEASEKARATIALIKEKYGKDLRIDTIKEVPADVVNRMAWAQERFKSLGVDGVYVVIANKPKIFEVVVGNKTLESGLFTRDNLQQTIALLKNNLKDSRDEALLQVANYTLESMGKQAKPAVVFQASPEFLPLRGVWLGPTMEVPIAENKEARVKEGKAKGRVQIRFLTIGKNYALELGYHAVLEDGGYIERSANRLMGLKSADGKRQVVVSDFDGDGPLLMTYEVSDDTLRISGTRKVRLGDTLEPVDLNGTWKRFAGK